MKYTQGKVGRAFVARVENGDDLLDQLKLLAEKENIEAAVLYIIGALKDASLVVGPRECTLPPDPVWRQFDDGREIIGLGNMFREQGGQEPVFHLHGALGRGDETLVGCIRGQSKVYLVAEVIILELTGTGAMKAVDPVTGLKMLSL